MNKNLYDRKAKLPITLVKHLENSFNSVEADTNIEGFNRNQELRETGIASYQQLKRIKNWFDGYQGKKEDAPFILNGGDRMQKWCNHVLDHWRNVDMAGKKIKSDGGMENQFIDSHEKNGLIINPHDKHEKGINKFDTSIQESITKRFKRLI